MKKSQSDATTAKNLEGKFDRGEDVLNYFDVRKARVIDPESKGSPAKAKFSYPVKHNAKRPTACHAEAGRRRVVREKSVRYRKKK
jgi:hypothetical protein